MASILSKTIITNAKGSVDTYISTANALSTELNGILTTLTTGNFCGDASDGYMTFYNSKVVPAITTNLTAPSGSLMSGIKEMLDSIEQQLLGTVDPKLGADNANPGGSAQ